MRGDNAAFASKSMWVDNWKYIKNNAMLNLNFVSFVAEHVLKGNFKIIRKYVR